MDRFRCTICNYIYDERAEGTRFTELPGDWRCPVCNASKEAFVLLSAPAEQEPGGVRTVSDVIIEQMAAWGVQYVFGIPGTSTLGLIDAIRRRPQVKYFQVRHEQTAAFMASAYGKLTGHLAACLTVAGPGATNLATGLYDAALDRSPVLALTGLVKRQLIGPGSFQEIDQHSFFEPICVFNKTVMSEDQTATLTTLAIKHALVERGVSHLSVPNDLQKLPCDTDILPMPGRIANRNVSPGDHLIRQAATVIDRARRPVVIVGFGASGQGDKLLQLARTISAPIVTTFRGKGVVDEGDELYVGSHGTIGSTAAARLVRESDLLIVVGSSFSDMTQIPAKSIVQIDIDPMMIAKSHPVEIGLWGSSSEVLPRLTGAVTASRKTPYLEEIARLKKEWLAMLDEEADSSRTPIRPQFIMKVLNDTIANDAVVSLDVGENGWWFGRNFSMKQTQKMVMSGYLASMGVGLPGALAGQIAFPGRQVICITGDGGFSMVMGDFMTAVKYDLPVKVFVLNNRQLGMIAQEQKVENYPNWQTDLHNCDFAEYARSCGGTGIGIDNPGKLKDSVDEALAVEGPVIVDVDTDPRRFV